MAEPCGGRAIGSAIAHRRQRANPSRAFVAGILDDRGKAQKNRSITFQAFADRLLMATQLFRPSLKAARSKMCVQVVEVLEPWHRH